MIKPYYEAKGITIYNGDSREILPNIGHHDLVLTDPPYGINLKYDVYNDTEDNWFVLLDAVIPLMRACADMVILPCCQIKRLSWFYKNHEPDWLMVWHKGSTGHRSMIGFNDFEPMLVYGRTKGLSMHDYLSVHNTEKMGSYGHPCPKPIKWAKWILS